MEEMKSRVYIKVDDNNRVTQIEGEYSLSNLGNLDECILIEEGTPCDKLNHAQNAYLAKPLRDMRGIYQYKYVNGEIVERTQAEIDADYVEPTPVPTELDRISAQALYTAVMTDTVLED